MSFKINTAEFVKAIVRPEQAPPPRPAVAFAGRSNVGKSSLINRLTGKKDLARTSNTPGRTQEIIYFDIDDRWHFVDLPGYGYAKVPVAVKRKWGPMIERYLRKAAGLRLIVVILDIRRDPSPDDVQLLQWVENQTVPYLLAVTKTDKLSRPEQRKRIEALRKSLGFGHDGEDGFIPVSSKTGEGIPELLDVIKRVLESPEPERDPERKMEKGIGADGSETGSDDEDCNDEDFGDSHLL